MSNKLKIARRTTGSIPRTDKNGVKYNQYYYLILPSSDKLAVEQFKADMAENGIKLIYDEDGKFGTNTGCLLYSTRNIIPTGAELERVVFKTCDCYSPKMFSSSSLSSTSSTTSSSS